MFQIPVALCNHSRFQLRGNYGSEFAEHDRVIDGNHSSSGGLLEIISLRNTGPPIIILLPST